MPGRVGPMTAIEVLLEKAGEICGAGTSEIAPALGQMADAQASMAEALACFYEAAADVSALEAFRYGFVLPAEPPEIKVDQGEKAADTRTSGVSLGPINVYAITQEVQKALNGVGRNSIDVPTVFSNFATPKTAIEMPSPARQPEVFGPAEVKTSTGNPMTSPAGNTVERLRSFDGDKKERKRHESAEEWVENSVVRSNIVMNRLSGVRQNIVDRTITEDKVREISNGSLSISSALSSGYETPAMPVKEPTLTEPARVREFESAGTTPPVGRDNARSSQPRAYTASPENPAASPEQPQETVRSSVLRKVVEAPPIRPRIKVISPAEDAAFNASKLSDALARSASPEIKFDGRDSKPLPIEKPLRIDWPPQPQLSPGTASRAIGRENSRSGPAFAAMPSSAAAEPGVAFATAPVAQVVRSFATMNEYVRAMSELGARSVAENGGTAPVSAGAMIVDAMTGMSATAQSPLSSAREAPVADLQRALTMHTPASLTRTQDAQQSETRPVPAMGSPLLSQVSGRQDSIVPGARPTVRYMQPAIGLAANIAAAQAGQRAGISMIQQLVRSTPHVAGTVAPQASTVYEGFGGLSMNPITSPAAASGAENIVNITVPHAAAGRVNENSTTNKVSNFHNTFNITVNVKGGEERDLKDLGRKIGQILSDEMKRYGGI